MVQVDFEQFLETYRNVEDDAATVCRTYLIAREGEENKGEKLPFEDVDYIRLAGFDYSGGMILHTYNEENYDFRVIVLPARLLWDGKAAEEGAKIRDEIRVAREIERKLAMEERDAHDKIWLERLLQRYGVPEAWRNK